MSRSRSLVVLFLIDSLGTGGSERSLLSLLPHYAEHGVECVISYLKGQEHQFTLNRGESLEVCQLAGHNALNQLGTLRRLTHRAAPDLIHTSLFTANLMGRLAAIGTGVPVITSLVNTSYAPARFRDPNIRAWKLRVVQTIDAITGFLLTTHFHAVTKAVKQSAVRDLRLPAHRISVVERGRAKEEFQFTEARRKRARHRLGIGDGEKVILNVGRQEYSKNQSTLIKAFAEIPQDGVKVQLLIAGRPGHETTKLKKLVSDLDISSHVRFLGHRNDVPDLLAAADLFVFPSHYEGTGGAMIEAMAMGLPIIASDIPPLREVAEGDRGAMYADPDDPRDLAIAMAKLLQDRQAATHYGKQARDIFEERFTLEANAQRMVELYRQIANK